MTITPIQIKAAIRSLYGITKSYDEAIELVKVLSITDFQKDFEVLASSYQRRCVNCGRKYAVERTNAPVEGFCPVCDNDVYRTELTRVHAQNRRALRENRPATLTFKQWLKTLEDFNWKCAYCLKFPVTAMEHFVPLKRGGGTTHDNVVPACHFCNYRKRSRDPRRVKNMRINPHDVERVRLYLKKRKENG